MFSNVGSTNPGSVHYTKALDNNNYFVLEELEVLEFKCISGHAKG